MPEQHDPSLTLFPPALRARIARVIAALAKPVARLGEGKLEQAGLRGAREFAGHAPYAPGDDLRHVDWAAYGRLGKLYVRQFERERDVSMTIALDFSRSMLDFDWHAPDSQSASKLAQIAQIAACISNSALLQGVSVRLATQGASQRFDKAASMPALYAWLSRAALNATRNDHPTNGERYLAELARSIRQARSGAERVLVLSDLMEAATSAGEFLPLLRGGGKLGLICVLSPSELHPEARGATRLISRETSDELSLTIDSAALTRYQRELAKHLDTWRELIAARGGTLEVISSASTLEELMLSTLARKGAVR